MRTNIIWSVWRWSVRNIWIHLFWSFHQLSGLQPKQIFDADQQATGHHSCARSLCMVACFKFQNNSWIKRFREIGGNFTTLPQLFKQHGYHSIIAGKIFHRYKLQNSMIAGENSPRNITSCKSKIATNVSGRTTSVYLLVAFSRQWIKILAGLTMRQDPERTTTSPGRRSSMQTTKPTKENDCLGRNYLASINNHKMSEQIKKLVPGII